MEAFTEGVEAFGWAAVINDDMGVFLSMNEKQEMRAVQDSQWDNLPDHIQRVLKRNRKMNDRKAKRLRWRDACKGKVTRWP